MREGGAWKEFRGGALARTQESLGLSLNTGEQQKTVRREEESKQGELGRTWAGLGEAALVEEASLGQLAGTAEDFTLAWALP